MLAKATSTQKLLALVASFSVLLAACGSHAGAAGDESHVRVIRDPDNPAFTGTVSDRTIETVRDPENPYWIGYAPSNESYGTARTAGLR
jgi:hypothetical protein